MRSIFITFILLLTAIVGQAQDHEINGTVVAFNTYPLKNVPVKAKRARTQVKTDELGHFRIKVSKNDVLTVEADAFRSYRHQVTTEDETLRINLIYEDRQKNKAIATQAGYLSPEDLEFGIRNLSDENNVFSNFTNVFDAIHYAVPAATFIVENGQKKVQLRGPKSLTGSNAALMVVNGVIVEDLGFVVPDEIVSIKQLTGPSAALYGARAGNGVISITTK